MATRKPRRRGLSTLHDPDGYLLSDIPGDVVSTLSLLQQCVENIDAHVTVAESAALRTAFEMHRLVVKHAFQRKRSAHDRTIVNLSNSPQRRTN